MRNGKVIEVSELSDSGPWLVWQVSESSNPSSPQLVLVSYIIPYLAFFLYLILSYHCQSFYSPDCPIACPFSPYILSYILYLFLYLILSYLFLFSPACCGRPWLGRSHLSRLPCLCRHHRLHRELVDILTRSLYHSYLAANCIFCLE